MKKETLKEYIFSVISETLTEYEAYKNGELTEYTGIETVKNAVNFLSEKIEEYYNELQICEYCKKPFYAEYKTPRCPNCVQANYGKEIIEEEE